MYFVVSAPDISPLLIQSCQAFLVEGRIALHYNKFSVLHPYPLAVMWVMNQSHVPTERQRFTFAHLVLGRS